MGEVQLNLIDDETLPPAKAKRRRVPDHLSPSLRKFVTRLARIGARLSWCVELVYHPSKGGQGELVERAKAGDHTLVLDTVREVEYQCSLLGDEIEVFMKPAHPLAAEPGSLERVDAMARRQAARQHLFDE
jgi:hypothetical protein